MQHNTAKELFDTLSGWLSGSGISLFEVSKRSGVAYNTIRSIRDGEGNPTMETLDKVYSVMVDAND